MNKFFMFVSMKLEILLDKTFCVGRTKDEKIIIHQVKKEMVKRNEERIKRRVNVYEYGLIKEMAELHCGLNITADDFLEHSAY